MKVYSCVMHAVKPTNGQSACELCTSQAELDEQGLFVFTADRCRQVWSMLVKTFCIAARVMHSRPLG